MAVSGKFNTVKSLVAFLYRRRFADFFFGISKYIPYWLFKFNQGLLITVTSPRIIRRNFKRYEFSWATAEDLADIEQLTDVAGYRSKKRLGAGDTCYIARDIVDGNRIVHVTWVHQGSCFVRGFGYFHTVEDDSAYLYGGYTSPPERMKGIMNTALDDIYAELNKKGINRIYALIEFWNDSSLKYHYRLGFDPVAKIIFISVFGIKLSINKNLDSNGSKFKVFFSLPRDRYMI
jgi:L-amino acid N-acyltransferase YncA